MMSFANKIKVTIKIKPISEAGLRHFNISGGYLYGSS